MKYCYECGHKLENKYLEDEGEIPYCSSCEQFRFPIFNVAISTEVLNLEKNKVLLIQQYGRKRNVLVAGYINKGETPEEALVREVKEEIGVNVLEYQYSKSEFFPPSNTLMINYSCIVDSELINPNDEVEKAQWFSFEEAKDQIAHDSVAERFLLEFLSKTE